MTARISETRCWMARISRVPVFVAPRSVARRSSAPRWRALTFAQLTFGMPIFMEPTSEQMERNYKDASAAYASLKTNFRGVGRFRDASWAYILERRMETKSLAPWRRFYQGTRLSRVVQGCGDWMRWLSGCVSGFVSGYGERPLRAFICVPVTVALYTVIFRSTESLRRTDGTSASLRSCFEHSLASFTTMSVSDVVPRSLTGQILTNLDALTGVSLVALVMFALGRRITRS